MQSGKHARSTRRPAGQRSSQSVCVVWKWPIPPGSTEVAVDLAVDITKQRLLACGYLTNRTKWSVDNVCVRALVYGQNRRVSLFAEVFLRKPLVLQWIPRYLPL